MPVTPLPLLAKILVALLVVWEPLTFAVTISSALPRLAVYGYPAYLLAAYRALVVGVGVAAGRALWGAAPGAIRLGQAWAVAHIVALVVTFATPFFPSNRVPGTKGPTLALLVAMDVAWWVWLSRSKRLRRALG